MVQILKETKTTEDTSCDVESVPKVNKDSSNIDHENDYDDDNIGKQLEKSTVFFDYSNTSRLTTLQVIMLWIKLK
jgi:hypothetical protein